MNHQRCHKQKYQSYLLFAITILLFTNSMTAEKQFQAEININEYKDEDFYFSVRFPNDWKLEPKTETISLIRLSAISSDQQQAVFIYAIHAKGNIDLKKLASQDRNLFKDLGKLISTTKVRKYLVSLQRIEKVYHSEQIWTKLVFQSDATFGYVIMLRGIYDDFSDFDGIVKTFTTDVPFIVAIKDRFPGWGSLLGNIVRAVVLFGVPSGLAMLSFSTRKKPMLNFITIMFGTGATGYLIWRWTSWKLALLGGGFILLAMILGRIGFFIWLEED